MIRTNPEQAVRAPITSNLAADEGDGGGGGDKEPLGGGAEEGGNVGLRPAALDGGDGEGATLLGGGRRAEGVGGGDGTVGVVEGGGAEAARVSISSFIPLRQCPPVPQMKYLLPEEVRGMTVTPPV